LILELSIIAISLIFLSYASLSDLKNREVPDKVWIAFFPIAIAFTLLRIALKEIPLFMALISIALTFIVSFILFELNFFGGADFKALVCIGIAFPSFPAFLKHFNIFPISFHPFFPIVVLYNAYFISLSTIFHIVIKNLLWILKNNKRIFEGFESEPFWKKFIVFITSYKQELSILEKKTHLYPIEEIFEANGKKFKRLKTFISVEFNKSEFIEKLKSYEKIDSSSQIWVTPGLPMIIFLTISFVLSVFIGDALFFAVFMLIKTVLK
jgi:preflagellin peptidase FlaK